MSVSSFVQKLVPLDDLKATVLRFPLSVISTFAIFVVGVLMTHEVIKDVDDDFIAKICAFLGCGYFWFGICKLVAESRGWPVVRHMALAMAGVAALGYIVFVPFLWWLHLAFIAPALLLLVMVAAYLRKEGDDLSFWFFNRQVWFGVVVSYIALFMFAGGCSAALYAIEKLFDVKISGNVYFDMWLFASLVLGPVYALSWVPEKFTFTKDDCIDPPGLRFMANWISVPMVLVYLLILYAYFGKIIVTGDVPKGVLAYMISGFIGAGVVAYLVSWPLREDGTAQLRLFHRIFFPAILVPTAFHFYAIWERVSAYGFTEQRYYLLLSAIWFAFLGLGFTFRKLPIKFIPGILAVLLIIGGIGPWSGVAVSGHSQFSRLEHLLVKDHLLVDGKIVKAEGELPIEDRVAIGSILDYLCNSDRDYMIADRFAFTGYSGEPCGHCIGGSALTEQLGFKYVTYYDRGESSDEERISITHYSGNFYAVTGYDYVLSAQNAYRSNVNPKKPCDSPDDPMAVCAVLDRDANLIVYQGNKELIRRNITDFVLAQWEKDKHAALDKKDFYLDMESEKVKMRVEFSSIYGEIKDGKPQVNNVSFNLLYSFKD